MKLIAHIGAPKTATTHIQAILRENSRRIEEAGYRYLGPGNIRKTEHWKRIFAYYRGNASLDDLAHIGELLPKADQILFSEEGITHDLMPRGPAEGGFGNVEQSANVLEMLGRTTYMSFSRFAGRITFSPRLMRITSIAGP